MARYTAWYKLHESDPWTSTGINTTDEPTARWAWDNFVRSNSWKNGARYHAVKYLPEGVDP